MKTLKVGDRVRLEGVVKELHRGNYWILLNGDNNSLYLNQSEADQAEIITPEATEAVKADKDNFCFKNDGSTNAIRAKSMVMINDTNWFSEWNYYGMYDGRPNGWIMKPSHVGEVAPTDAIRLMSPELAEAWEPKADELCEFSDYPDFPISETVHLNFIKTSKITSKHIGEDHVGQVGRYLYIRPITPEPVTAEEELDEIFAPMMLPSERKQKVWVWHTKHTPPSYKFPSLKEFIEHHSAESPLHKTHAQALTATYAHFNINKEGYYSTPPSAVKEVSEPTDEEILEYFSSITAKGHSYDTAKLDTVRHFLTEYQNGGQPK